VWEVLFAKYAAPGMFNPDDEHPCTTGTPSQEQIDRDTRTVAQRRHDAMVFVGRHALDKTELGQLNGLPTTIIVRTTLQDLESRTGVGVSGGGTVLPLTDLLQLAAEVNTNHYLAVFDRATGSALDLFRARRTASVAQRLMLISRDGGCTKPNCTVSAYGSQVHHAALDWIFGGLTNVDDMALACGPDNRMVGPDGWTTRINDQHEVEWIPPPHLDTGQTRTNDYHHPEKLRPPPDDAWTPPTAADDQRAGDEPVDTDDEPAADEPAVTDELATNGDNGTHELSDPDLPGDDAWVSDESPASDGSEAAPDDAPAITDPPATDEPTTNDDNTTRESGGPDPPDGKAA
jgi:hypothetical protein